MQMKQFHVVTTNNTRDKRLRMIHNYITKDEIQNGREFVLLLEYLHNVVIFIFYFYLYL